MTSVRRQRSSEPGSGSPDINTRIGPQKVKRRRLHTACRICQDRKTRCDGERPTCSTCRRRGVAADCAYDDAAVPPESRAPQDRSSLAAFEERLGRLEQTRVIPASGYDQDNGDTIRRDSFRSATCISLSDENTYSTPIIRPSATGLPTPHTVQESTEIDGLATVSAFDDGDCLYGASSIIALTRFFRGKVAERNGFPADQNPETGCRSTSSRDSQITIPEIIREADIGAGLYPPRLLSDNFVSCFWEFVHPLFPVLHKTSFMQRYHLFWADQIQLRTLSEPSVQHDHAIFASTLNIIFSLGCQFSTHVAAGKCTTLAYDFYQRSRKLYNYELMDSMSIPLVQMLLLSGVYLQSAQNADRCWNTIGLAIRVAQGLGLHVERPGSSVKGQLDREMRRRIWHCCLVLDRLLSMTFGRPVMISARDGVPTPSLIDDDYLEANGEGSQPTGRPSGLGLLVYSSKLFNILDNILSEFYSSSQGRSITEMTADHIQADGILSSIMSHNRQLDDFLKEIPNYMRYAALPTSATSEPGEKTVEIQRQILHCRFLYTRLLLFRPVVYLSTKFPDLFLSQSSQTSHDMDDYLVKFICKSCVQVAFELISAIHRSLGHSHRSSAWHAIYFTFGAAVVLLCTQICPAVDLSVLQQDFEQHWGEAQEILNYYRIQRPVARQSIQTLKALRDSMQQDSAAPETATDTQGHVPFFMDFSDFDLLGAGPASLDTLFNLDMADYSGLN